MINGTLIVLIPAIAGKQSGKLQPLQRLTEKGIIGAEHVDRPGCILQHDHEMRTRGIAAVGMEHTQTAVAEFTRIVRAIVQRHFSIHAKGRFLFKVIDLQQRIFVAVDGNSAIVEAGIGKMYECADCVGCKSGIQFASDHIFVLEKDLESRQKRLLFLGRQRSFSFPNQYRELRFHYTCFLLCLQGAALQTQPGCVMMDRYQERMFQMKIIAHIRNAFPTKFGLPRQSGLVKELRSTIVFEPDYRNPEALRGLDGYSHLWLLWKFHKVNQKEWSPTVRPPRLGGNTRMGVFATRSPFRPNPIGLSCVKLESIEQTANDGLVLHISGADLMDGTPIFDIKPYLPYVDSIPDAIGGFSSLHENDHVDVCFSKEHLCKVPAELQSGLIGVLRQDPRPAYQHDPERIYGFEYAGFEVRFRVSDGTLTVCEVEKLK